MIRLTIAACQTDAMQRRLQALLAALRPLAHEFRRELQAGAARKRGGARAEITHRDDGQIEPTLAVRELAGAIVPARRALAL